MVHASPTTPYLTLLQPFLLKKKSLGLDKWGRDDSPHNPNPIPPHTPIPEIYAPLLQHMENSIPPEFLNKRYPPQWKLAGHVHRVLREMLFSEILCWEYASYFRDKTLEELDVLAASFKLENCIRREGLNSILKGDAES